MSYLVVLPSIWPPYTADCLNSMSFDLRANTYIVDNAHGNNIGVAKSWNKGIAEMRRLGRDWLILLSAAVRFGKPGGDDFTAHLTDDFDAVEARPVYGWHLIAFHRRMFDAIGRFDENLWNYYGDIDWTLRVQRHYAPKDAPWNKVTIDVTDMGMAHGLHLAGVIDSAEPYITYMTRKWGRHPDQSTVLAFEHPFNDSSNSLDHWPNA